MPPAVAVHRRRLDVGREGDPLRGEEPGVHRGALRADVGEVERRARDQEVGALGLGELADVVDQRREPQRLGVHRLEVLRARPAMTPSCAASMRETIPATGVRSSCAMSAAAARRSSSSRASVEARWLKASASCASSDAAADAGARAEVAAAHALGRVGEAPQRAHERGGHDRGREQREPEREAGAHLEQPVELLVQRRVLGAEDVAAHGAQLEPPDGPPRTTIGARRRPARDGRAVRGRPSARGRPGRSR